jgi:hypothetical protein
VTKVKIELGDEEFAQLTRYKTQLEGTKEQITAVQKQADKQIAQLVGQGNEIKQVLNTTWLAANRRAKLEDPELIDVEIPPMVSDMGELLVNLKAKDKTAHWPRVHDVKRIASEDEAVQDKSDEEENGDDHSS